VSVGDAGDGTIVCRNLGDGAVPLHWGFVHTNLAAFRTYTSADAPPLAKWPPKRTIVPAVPMAQVRWWASAGGASPEALGRPQDLRPRLAVRSSLERLR
jgi:hypothetical protein